MTAIEILFLLITLGSLAVTYYCRWDADDARAHQADAENRLYEAQRVNERLVADCVCRGAWHAPGVQPIYDRLSVESFRRQLDEGRQA